MKFFLVLVLFSGLFSGNAQDSSYRPYKKPANIDNTSFWDKCYSGGDLMFYGRSGSMFFNISPVLGYRPNNKGFSYGVGVTYQYSSFTYYSNSNSYSFYGVRAFVRQDLGNMFFVHGELENYFTKDKNIITLKKEMISIPCANIFVGYKQKFSEFSYYFIMIGYGAMSDPKSQQFLPQMYVYPLYPLILKAGYILDIKGK